MCAPGGEYILRCLQGHKMLFGAATDKSQPPKLGHGATPMDAAGKSSLFLEALPPSDTQFLRSTKLMALEGMQEGVPAVVGLFLPVHE